MSSFSGLNTALSALWAQRQGLDTTGQNISNVNTDGYSRQRVRLEAIGGPTTPSMFSQTRMPGGGVRAVEFERVRDAFLEARALQEHATDSGLRQTQSVLSRVELAFAEPGTNGLQTQLANFWGAWDDVANRPSDPGARAQLVQQAQTVATTFNHVASSLTALRGASTEQLHNTVIEVNATAAQIAQLNGAIQNAVNAGMSPNDLLDQRDRLVSQLAASVGATTRPGAAGAVDVVVGGSALVSGDTHEDLGVTVAPSGSVTVTWARLGVPADASGGQVGGLVDAVNNVIPKYQTQLDGIAKQLATVVNAQHAKGVDAYGNPGGAFFTGTGAASLGVASALAGDPKLVAAAAPGAGPLDGSNAQALAGFGATSIPDPTSGANPPPTISSPDAVYRQLVTQLGVDSQRANRQVDVQAQITSQVDAARKSVSSVSLDEEMTNMLAFQHAYSAAAKFMNSVDETIQTLLGMGRG